MLYGVPPLVRQLFDVQRVIWDFDGVIADTEPVQAHAYEVVLANHGVPVEPGWFNKYVGTPEPHIWSMLDDLHHLKTSNMGLAEERATVYAELTTTLHPAWYVPTILELDTEHVIVSAGNHHQIVTLLNRWGLTDRFTTIRATGSPDTPPDEPKAERITATCHAGTVLLEDSARYLHMATAAGAATIGVQHQFNTLTTDDSNILIAHTRPNVWMYHQQHPAR